MEASRGGVRRRHPPGVARAVRGARAAGAARVVDDGGRGHEGMKNENHTTFLPCSRTCLVLTHYKMTGFDLTFSHLRHFTVLAVSSLSLSQSIYLLCCSLHRIHKFTQLHPPSHLDFIHLLPPPTSTPHCRRRRRRFERTWLHTRLPYKHHLLWQTYNISHPPSSPSPPVPAAGSSVVCCDAWPGKYPSRSTAPAALPEGTTTLLGGPPAR